MIPDFPAAHSMDTDWFAVDRNGHVAHFDTGTDGAAPVDTGYSGGDVFEVEDGVRGLAPAGEAVWDPEGLRNNAWTPHAGLKLPQERLLVLLRTAADGAALPWPDGARPLRALAGAALLVPAMPAPLAKALHGDGLCQGCMLPPSRFLDGHRMDLAALGFFAYDAFGLAIAGPYGRQRVPLRPRTVADLPPDVRALVGKNVFPSLCFQEQARIQPVAHFPCRTWTGLWLDGRVVRFLPGEKDRWDGLDYARVKQIWEEAGFSVEPEPPRSA
jgi:hypothetical protein